MVLVVMSTVRPAGYVSACECDYSSPSLADQVGAAEIAFVGRLDASAQLNPPEEHGGSSYDRRYELVVESPVKGVGVGDRVTMFGSTVETSCGSSLLDEQLDQYAIVTSSYGGPFVADSTPTCSRVPTVPELLAVDRQLPPTAAGELSLVVEGRLGEAELVGYDESGRVLSYGDVRGTGGPLAVCPSSSRLVSLEQPSVSGGPELIVRDAATLQIVERSALELSPDLPSETGWLLVGGADLTCLSQDGRETVITLSWENATDGDTLVIHHRPDEAGGTTVAAYVRADRATFDDRIGSVVAVANGELVRLALTGSRSAIAQVADPATEPGYGALFITADDADGWWVGVGDSEREIPSRLQALVHVGADGVVERWPVTLSADLEWMHFSEASPRIVNGAIVGDSVRIPLPVIGSSTTAAPVIPEPAAQVPYRVRLDDGRTVSPRTDEVIAAFELTSADGSAVTLQHLAAVRLAVAVPAGPWVEPGSVVRTVPDELVDSPWIQRTMTGASADTTMVEPNASSEEGAAGTTSSAPPPQRAAAESGGVSPLSVIAAVIGFTACAGGAIWWIARRRRGAQIKVA